MNENEAITVTLTLENDEELECAVLSIFEAEEREYIALLPLDENGDNDDGQVFLYRFIDNGEDAEPDLENIEDDQEFERVSNAFNELMEEQDFADIDLPVFFVSDSPFHAILLLGFSKNPPPFMSC